MSGGVAGAIGQPLPLCRLLATYESFFSPHETHLPHAPPPCQRHIYAESLAELGMPPRSGYHYF
jgi:hypothetical protein